MAKSHLLTFGLQSSKFFQWHIALDREVLQRWAQVLPDGENIDIMLTQVLHNCNLLIPCLTEAEHEAGLGRSGRVHFFGPVEHLERTLIDGLRAHALVEPGNRLYVVIVDIGFRVNYYTQGIIYPVEVRGQALNERLRVQAANRADGSGEDGGAAIFQFVTVHGGDDRVPQSHLLYCLGHAFRLLPVQPDGAAGLHGAKATTPCTDTPEDHEGGRLMAPTFANIWAAGLLAHGMQVLTAHQLLQVFVVFPPGGSHLEPFRTPFWNYGQHGDFPLVVPRFIMCNSFIFTLFIVGNSFSQYTSISRP